MLTRCFSCLIARLQLQIVHCIWAKEYFGKSLHYFFALMLQKISPDTEETSVATPQEKSIRLYRINKMFLLWSCAKAWKWNTIPSIITARSKGQYIIYSIGFVSQEPVCVLRSCAIPVKYLWLRCNQAARNVWSYVLWSWYLLLLYIHI